jgi:flagellin
MAAVINTNMASLQAQNQLSRTTTSLNNTIQQLSSGLRVSSAADDASGYAISKNMNSVIRGSAVAIRNANDAISLAQTSAGAIETLSNITARMREIAVQSANDSNVTNATLLNVEFQALADEADRVLASTEFNKVKVFSTAAFSFQVSSGSLTVANDTVSLTTTVLPALTLATASTVSVATQTGSTSAMALLDTSITELNTVAATLGAFQNRMSFAIENLTSLSQSVTAAKSRILDTDFAAQTAQLSKYQILQQAGTAMLAQANQMGSNVLTLLK